MNLGVKNEKKKFPKKVSPPLSNFVEIKQKFNKKSIKLAKFNKNQRFKIKQNSTKFNKFNNESI